MEIYLNDQVIIKSEIKELQPTNHPEVYVILDNGISILIRDDESKRIQEQV